MATQAFGVNDQRTVKLWSKGLEAEVLKKTSVGKFIGSRSDSLIQQKDETSKSEGDRIRVSLRMQLTGDGVTGNNTLEGNEENYTVHSDDLFIEQLRHAVRFNRRIDQQRVPFELREEARLALADWWDGRLDEVFFNPAIEAAV